MRRAKFKGRGIAPLAGNLYTVQMMTMRLENDLPAAGLSFLKHCYHFVNTVWQHTDRDASPDQGFERAFRASCVSLGGWEISQEREMRLGQGLPTASGVLHEIDIVAVHPEVNAILELKNRQDTPGKNDIALFFAKMVDYLAINPPLLLKEFLPVFMSTTGFEQNGLAACLGLGIHPVAPGLRPVPVLIDNAKRINGVLRKDIRVSEETLDRFDDFRAELNGICLNLADSWFGSGFGYRAENTIVLRAAPEPDSQTNSYLLRRLNSECSWLISSVKEAVQ